MKTTKFVKVLAVVAVVLTGVSVKVPQFHVTKPVLACVQAQTADVPLLIVHVSYVNVSASSAVYAQLTPPTLTGLTTNDPTQFATAAVNGLNFGITGVMLVSGIVLLLVVVFLIIRAFRPKTG